MNESFLQAATPTEGVGFFTSDLGKAEAHISEIFCPHRLTPIDSLPCDGVRLQHRPLHSTSLNTLSYGQAVFIDPAIFKDFYLLQVPLSGLARINCAGQEIDIGVGDAALLPATEKLGMEWSRDCSNLVLRIDRLAMQNCLEQLIGNHLTDPIQFDAKLRWGHNENDMLRELLRLVDTILPEQPALAGCRTALWHFEQSMMCALLFGHNHNYRRGLEGGISPAAPRQVKAAEEYISMNAKEPISIEDLVQVSGVSARALFESFRRFRGMSPMRYVRRHRLEGARADLLSASADAKVTDIAIKWGFLQLGRFAVEYKRQFGESPSATLKRRAH